jgi:2-keto-4-pentenoate hydratase
MTADDFSAARAALVDARRRARRLAECPPRWRPADLAEAYRLQAAVMAELGGSRGWKVGALTDAQRSAMGVPRPVAGALSSASMHDASEQPATLRLADFIAPKIECEFAFQLRHDLPPRSAGSYSHVQVAHAIGALRLGIEIVDPRWPAGSGALAEVADAFNNGAFVAGPAVSDWLALDFATLGIVLTVEAPGQAPRTLAEGNGGAILDGDPLGAVVLLANAQPSNGPGLRAGDIVTTGSCTGAPYLPGLGFYRAEFAGLGSVALRVE